MSISSKTRRASALALCGAALGGAVGYVVSASAEARHTSASRTTASSAARRAGRASAAGDRRSRLRRAVSITAVVPTRDGRFTTVSIARGVLVGTSSDSLTLRESTRKFAYKTVTLPVGADARVRLAKQPSSLGALSAGDRVAVITGPRGTAIVARSTKDGRAPTTSQSAQGGESTPSDS